MSTLAGSSASGGRANRKNLPASLSSPVATPYLSTAFSRHRGFVPGTIAASSHRIEALLASMAPATTSTVTPLPTSTSAPLGMRKFTYSCSGPAFLTMTGTLRA